MPKELDFIQLLDEKEVQSLLKSLELEIDEEIKNSTNRKHKTGKNYK